MNKIKKYCLVLRSKSIRYTLFRVSFELRKKLGLIKKQFPAVVHVVPLISLHEWKESALRYFFDGNLKIIETDDDKVREAVNLILSGDVLYFGKEWKHLGLDFDWITNPETSYQYDIGHHWSSIESLSAETGDIKFVWEPSRFCSVYPIIRYDQMKGEDHSNFVINLILDWIQKNPINCGPNWKCSQEVSLRIQNWIFALNFYKDSSFLTEERWQIIAQSLYWQGKHVYDNINYSRISVRNNHAITETLNLYLMGLMFPSFPDAGKWKKNGKKWFEQEIAYQIEEDGTYLQDSMNYHRVVLQLLTLGISLAELNGEHFSDVVYDHAYKSLDFLYQCQDDVTGWLPNYGSNDGALFFPLNDSDFRDYRPQLDALHYLLTGRSLYGTSYEDRLWICPSPMKSRSLYPPVTKKQGVVTFGRSGFYLIREGDTFSMMRSGLFKNNGSVDQLHLDIWKDGHNFLLDSGTFKYNTNPDTNRYFTGTESHNTIMLGDNDQMLKGPRFMWFYKPTILRTVTEESISAYTIEATLKCFSYLGKEIILKRKVVKKKGVPHWEISDIVENKPHDIPMRQLWHTLDKINITSSAEIVTKEKMQSSYYGYKTACWQIESVTNSKEIKTSINLE